MEEEGVGKQGSQPPMQDVATASEGQGGAQQEAQQETGLRLRV